MSNKQVIAIFVIGVGLLLGAFWAGLYVVKQDASASPSQSRVTSQSAGSSNPGTQAAAAKSVPANANTQTQSQPQQPSSSDTRYIVQVGASFGTVEKANELTAQLKKKYLGAHTQNPTGGDTLYRVRIGPYDRRDDAQQVANELSSQGFKGVMIFPWTGN
jgi:cell division protein FtsN